MWIEIQALRNSIASIREENSSIRERLAVYEGMNDSKAPKERKGIPLAIRQGQATVPNMTQTVAKTASNHTML